MVAPLARLSGEVDKVAGGDLTIAVPRSRIAEIANIAQAVEGMTDALGETAQRRAEADEARRFLVTSIAHDLRTPLFALRGHLQAIGSRLGDPAVHLERAEARADALERLIGNLFAYTRDDYAQPAPQLEAVPVAGLLEEVTAGLEHTTRLRDNSVRPRGRPGARRHRRPRPLKRALTNILDNALRYSPPGAPINLSWTAADESTVLTTIHDHGPGIDPDLLPTSSNPASAEPRQPAASTAAPGSASRSRNASSNTNTRPSRRQPPDRGRGHLPHPAAGALTTRPRGTRRRSETGHTPQGAVMTTLPVSPRFTSGRSEDALGHDHGGAADFDRVDPSIRAARDGDGTDGRPISAP